MPKWQRNLYVLTFCSFWIAISFGLVTPFMSFYIETLGDFSNAQVNILSGVVFAALFVTMAITAPIWGKMADNRGRKVMLIRSSLGSGMTFILMGLAPNVWVLILGRALQGVFAGYVGNANAMVASEVPREKAGKAMGVLVTGSTAGMLIGPLIGGALNQVFGYRTIFFLTSCTMFFVFLLTWWFIYEDKSKIIAKVKTTSEKFGQVLARTQAKSLIIGLFFTTLIVNLANMSINPIVSLYVKELARGNTDHLALTAGIVAAAPGIATIMFATILGRLGDKFGTHRMIVAGFIIIMLSLIPSAFVTSNWQLIATRFMIGIGDATMLPAINALISKNTPRDITSRIFNYNITFQALGQIGGSLLGAIIAAQFDYPQVFILTSVIVLINLLLFKFRVIKNL
jgi:DHA1 family multidrug resistance protein-like MFS transporter